MPGKIRFYLDEHVPRAVVQGLRERGVDIKTVGEAGLLSAPDTAHLQRARAERRVIFTQDSDFLRLHAAGHPHICFRFSIGPPGIVSHGAAIDLYFVLTITQRLPPFWFQLRIGRVCTICSEPFGDWVGCSSHLRKFTKTSVASYGSFKSSMDTVSDRLIHSPTRSSLRCQPVPSVGPS